MKTGKEIVVEIEDWLNRHNVHPDDFDMMFAKELLKLMDGDN